MKANTLERLETALGRAGINQPARHELALTLFAAQASVEDITRLELIVRERGGHHGLLVTWIRSGDWQRILGEVRAAEEQQQQQIERAGKGTSSSIRFVAEGNPYGWADPERLRGADHGRVGEWNAFRQCHNSTGMFKRPGGSYDCRYLGSARFEVLGNHGEPTAEWDAEAVRRARGFSEDSEPVSSRQPGEDDDRDVLKGIYGA